MVRKMRIYNITDVLPLYKSYSGEVVLPDKKLLLITNRLAINKQKGSNILDREKGSVDERLKRLKKIQGKLEKTKVEHDRVMRCRELVDGLKDLYQNRCQLCGEENGIIPFIEKENGEYYSEMHHIVQLCEINNLDGEWQFIDTYQNAIICCVHHHRFLHHHHGGFKKKIFENGQVFLESRKGTRIRIIRNLHLTE